MGGEGGDDEEDDDEEDYIKGGRECVSTDEWMNEWMSEWEKRRRVVITPLPACLADMGEEEETLY